MHTYTKSLIVSEDDLDELEHVNNVRYVQWIQDIAKEHWQEAVPESIKQGIIWVVMTHHITYKSPAKLNDPIILNTYINKSKGAKSQRVVEMHNENTNQLLVRSVTDWCMLNSKTQRPMRITEDVMKLFEKES